MTFDPKSLTKSEDLLGLVLPCRLVDAVMKSNSLAPLLRKGPGRRCVYPPSKCDFVSVDPSVDVESLKAANDTRVLIFVSEVKNQSDLSPEVHTWLSDLQKANAANSNMIWCKVKVTQAYAEMTVAEALGALLPVPAPTSFETVGHIAHLNLLPVHEPYKHIIAQVLLDKHKCIRTVLNKVGDVKDEFRTLPYELIGGEDKLETTVIESGYRFAVDMKNVFWNSRLSSERARVVDLIRRDLEGEDLSKIDPAKLGAQPIEKKLRKGVIVCDVFCGVGGFGVYILEGLEARVQQAAARGRRGRGSPVGSSEGSVSERVEVYMNDKNEFAGNLIRKNYKNFENSVKFFNFCGFFFISFIFSKLFLKHRKTPIQSRQQLPHEFELFSLTNKRKPSKASMQHDTNARGDEVADPEIATVRAAPMSEEQCHLDESKESKVITSQPPPTAPEGLKRRGPQCIGNEEKKVKFTQEYVEDDRPIWFLMNLPALAVNFLKPFVGILRPAVLSRETTAATDYDDLPSENHNANDSTHDPSTEPNVIDFVKSNGQLEVRPIRALVYAFSREDDHFKAAQQMVEAVIGPTDDGRRYQILSVREVRDVSPKSRMIAILIELKLPLFEGG